MRAYYKPDGKVTLAVDSIILELPYIVLTDVPNYLDLRINLDTKEFYEGATDLQINEQTQQLKRAAMASFIKQKREDGEDFHKEMELELTLLLAGLLLTDLIPVNNEIESIIRPLINEIKAGDWFNVYMKTEITKSTTAPVNDILKPFYERIKNETKTYFETNYPR